MARLVLTVPRGKAVILSGGIRVSNVDGPPVRLSFEAPRSVTILREEVIAKNRTIDAKLLDARD